MDVRQITAIEHGVSGKEPESCPLCPECDQPIWASEELTFQTVAQDGWPDLARIVHRTCSTIDDEDDEQ